MISKLKLYYNLTKPGIIYGNLLTATAGFFFASHWDNSYGLLVAMLAGLGLIIGSGCVINNVIDKDIDKLMERTKKRAVVSGQVKDKTALVYASILWLGGVIILGVFTNGLCLGVALFGFIMYVVVYGWAKRKTPYSTLIGSLSGAVPPLVGYTAITGYIDIGGVLLVFILVCWQMTHFYAIALYRKGDYQKAKLPIWPIVKGDWSTQLQAIGFIGLFTLFGLSTFLFGYTGLIYIVAIFFLGLIWLWYAVLNARKLTPTIWGKKIFLSSLSVILILSVLLAVGPILP